MFKCRQCLGWIKEFKEENDGNISCECSSSALKKQVCELQRKIHRQQVKIDDYKFTSKKIIDMLINEDGKV